MDEGCRSFENAIPFFEAAKISTQTARAQLQKSGERLGFKIDPFLLPISSHRQIRELNENAYMDWFAWVLDVACQNTSQPLSLCARILALNEDAIQASDYYQDRPIITREFPVNKGDTLGIGRLDLLIIFPDKKHVFHIEAKVVNAEFAYLEKNKHYASYLEKQYPGCRNFILAADGKNGSYDGFVLITWKDICIRIRQWVAEREQKDLGCAMLLLFCAIIEQKLQALNTGSATQIAYIKRMDYMKDN